MRTKAPSGETESLNGLLDTMTNVIGVLILMLLASFLTVRQVAHTIEQKSALFSKAKTEQISDARMEGSRLEETLAELRTAAIDLETGMRPGGDTKILLEAKEKVSGSDTAAAELRAFDPDTMLASLRESEARLAALQGAVAMQEDLLRQFGQSHVNRVAGVAPTPRTRVARVPDPVDPPANAQGITFLCRYGHVTHCDQLQMEALLKKGYDAVVGSEGAKALPPLERYRRVELYFAANQIGRDGLRWRVHAEYDANEQSAKTFIQLRANLEWTDTGMGEGLESIDTTNSAYQQHLQSLSVKTNYLRFLVWPDSFAEYGVAREVADTRGLSSGWLPQEGDGMDYVLARTAIKTQVPLDFPRVAHERARYSSTGAPVLVTGSGGGGGEGGGGGSGSAGSGGGGGRASVD